MTLPTEVAHLIDNNDIEAAIVAIGKFMESAPDDASLYYERGRLYWRMECRRKAINDYTTSLSLDPSSPAKGALAQAMEIMNFYDKNRYNP